MALSKDRIIVIKSTNFSEADKILAVFGRIHGKFTLFAKGIRKITSKNRGNIQTISISNVTFYEGQNMGRLIESSSVHIPDLPHSKMKDASRILLLIYKLIPEGEPSPEIFDKLEKLILDNLPAENVNRVRLEILRELGYLPESSVCEICGEGDGLNYLDPESFTTVCGSCYSNDGIDGKKLLERNAVRKNISLQAKLIDDFVQRVIHET